MNIIQTLLRRYSASRQHEHVDPDQKGLFQNRMEDYAERYRFATSYVKNKSVLDIACGEGYGTSLLADAVDKITGVDSDEEAIAFALKRYGGAGHKNVTYLRADGFEFLEKNKELYDCIISFETIEHIHDATRFLKLLHLRLKPGGVLLLSTQNKLFSDIFFGGTCNPYHVKEFYTSELRDLIIEVFSGVPELYLQGPVSDNYRIISTIFTFLFRRSIIVKSFPGMCAINNIFVAKKGSV